MIWATKQRALNALLFGLNFFHTTGLLCHLLYDFTLRKTNRKTFMMKLVDIILYPDLTFNFKDRRDGYWLPCWDDNQMTTIWKTICDVFFSEKTREQDVNHILLCLFFPLKSNKKNRFLLQIGGKRMLPIVSRWCGQNYCSLGSLLCRIQNAHKPSNPQIVTLGIISLKKLLMLDSIYVNHTICFEANRIQKKDQHGLIYWEAGDIFFIYESQLYTVWGS